MKRRFGSSSPMECRPLTNLPVREMQLQRRAAHAGHDVHVQHHVRAVGDLHAVACQRRIERAHAVGHDVQRAALHAAGEQALIFVVRVGGCHPVVVRAGIFLVAGAHEGQVLDAGHIGRVGAGQMAAGKFLLVELEQLAAGLAAAP